MRNIGVLCIFVAALLWGISGGMAGLLISSDWAALTVSFYRGAIGVLFVLIWLLLRPRRSGLGNPRLWLWSIIAGIAVAGNFAFYFMSIEQSSLPVAVTLMYCAPVFVFLLSFFLRLEQLTPFKWVAIALVMTGVVLLTQIYQVDGASVTWAGALTGLLAGASLATFMFAFKYAAGHGSPQAVLLIAFSTLLVVFVGFIDQAEAASVMNSPDLGLFLLLGLLGGGLSFFLYIVGLRHTSPTIASIIAMVEPVTASLFGVLMLGEVLVTAQLVGMGIILVTAAALGSKSMPG